MSKVTYSRGERQKPTTPKFRDHYDKIDWSKPPQIPEDISEQDNDDKS